NLIASLSTDLPPVILGDSTRLRQILMNLLSNAIKFTQTGEISVYVTLAASPAADPSADPSATNLAADPAANPASPPSCTIQFAVHDTGIGIPANRLDRLFKPFSQIDASITRHYGGTGLGLVISQRLCELMGGRLWVESEMDHGSTFYFTVAVSVANPSVSLTSKGMPGTRTPTNQKQPLAERLPLQILLAEDNDVNQKVALLQLQHLGYRADLATNGLEVLAALRHRTYDVVLLDIQMPELDGLSTARQICQEWQPDRRPWLIAMTANAMQGDRQRCLEAGMDDYLSKPVRLEALVQALNRCSPRSKLQVVFPGPSPPPYSEMSPSDSPPTDAIVPEAFQAFRHNVGNNDAIVLPLVICYLEETPALLKTLGEAIDPNQSDCKPETVHRIAHSLKASSATLGAEQLATLCRELEQQTISEQPILATELMRWIVQLEAEFERVRLALQQIIQTQP
ncbi:MAG TPA: ATP-binding protein, partial [Allocoleopsis sp.]